MIHLHDPLKACAFQCRFLHEGSVKASDIKPSPSLQPAASTRGPPSKALKQNRWEIENFVGGEPVVLGEDVLKRDQTLYIAHCSDTVIQVRGAEEAVVCAPRPLRSVT